MAPRSKNFNKNVFVESSFIHFGTRASRTSFEIKDFSKNVRTFSKQEKNKFVYVGIIKLTSNNVLENRNMITSGFMAISG